MRALVPAIAAAALFGSATFAFALTATGSIKSVNKEYRIVTLNNGASFTAPGSVNLSAFKVGEDVMINYDKAGNRMALTSLKPAG